MPETPTPDPIATLRASHERLSAAVARLTEAQVRGRAYPAEWSVAQTLSHIGSGAEINSLVLEAGLTGAEPPARDAYPPIWDRWNAKSPAEQAADALDSDRRLVERVEAARGSDRRFQLWMGQVDLAGFASARLFEHAVHTWDVEVPFNLAATLDPAAVRIILPGLGFLIGFAAKPGGRTEEIHVATPDGSYRLTLGEKSTLEPWDGADATATLSIPAEAFVRLVYGRLDEAHTPAGVRAEGISLDELREIFPGF